MNTLTGHIEYLIVHHDCVTIPGVGALIAHYRPAHFDEEPGCLFPPTRTLGFNPEITHNDGLLVTSVARAMGIGYDAAAAIVNREVEALYAQVEAQGSCGIGRLGVINRAEGSSLIFVPHTSTAITPRLAGLRAIAAHPVEAVTTEESSSSLAPIILRSRPRLMARRALKAAASVALLLCLGITFSTPIVEHGDVAMAGISRLSSWVSTATSAQQAGSTSGLTAPASLIFATPINADATADIEPQAPVAEEPIAPHHYFLVVASLPTESLAKKFIAGQPSDRPLKWIEANGRYRIYVASAPTYGEARSHMAQADLASRYPDAWVCHF